MQPATTIVTATRKTATPQAIPGLTRGGKDSNFVWEVNDRFGRAKAVRIPHIDGSPTKFAMVYGHDGATDTWQPIRPVSDRYTPLPIGAVVDDAMLALNGDVDAKTAPRVRKDRFGTLIDVSAAMNDKIEIGKGKPFDTGHPWSNSIQRVHNGELSRDIVIPTFNIRSAYDATSAVYLDLGLFRLICENGAKVLMAGMRIRAIHTIHEVRNVVANVRESGQLKLDKPFLKSLPDIKIPLDTRKAILDGVPEKWHKPFNEYTELQKHSAWAVLNGLSYLQTHEYTLSRGRQLDKQMAMVFNTAMN